MPAPYSYGAVAFWGAPPPPPRTFYRGFADSPIPVPGPPILLPGLKNSNLEGGQNRFMTGQLPQNGKKTLPGSKKLAFYFILYVYLSTRKCYGLNNNSIIFS